MHAAVCKFISVSSHAFLLHNLVSVRLLQTANSSTTPSCPAGLLDPAHDDSTSLRNFNKYSSADAVKHHRRLECWKHRYKNVKSRIPYTWLFCWDIYNPVRLQVLAAVTIQTAFFQQGTPCVRYSTIVPAFLRYLLSPSSYLNSRCCRCPGMYNVECISVLVNNGLERIDRESVNTEFQK